MNGKKRNVKCCSFLDVTIALSLFCLTVLVILKNVALFFSRQSCCVKDSGGENKTHPCLRGVLFFKFFSFVCVALQLLAGTLEGS